MMPRKTDKLKPSRVQQVPIGSLETNITTSKLPGKLYHRWTWFEFWATQSWILHSATEVFPWTSRTCVPTAWHRGGQAHLCASHTWWTESLVPTCSNYKSLFTYHCNLQNLHIPTMCVWHCNKYTSKGTEVWRQHSAQSLAGIHRSAWNHCTQKQNLDPSLCNKIYRLVPMWLANHHPRIRMSRVLTLDALAVDFKIVTGSKHSRQLACEFKSC